MLLPRAFPAACLLLPTHYLHQPTSSRRGRGDNLIPLRLAEQTDRRVRC